MKIQRKCKEEGFNNLKRGRKLDDYSIEVNFCPAKATWYPRIVNLFEQCRVSLESGFLPDSGGLKDQSDLFMEVYPFFIERWRHRTYYKVWQDVIEFTPSILSAFGKMFAKLFGGSGGGKNR